MKSKVAFNIKLLFYSTYKATKATFKSTFINIFQSFTWNFELLTFFLENKINNDKIRESNKSIAIKLNKW